MPDHTEPELKLLTNSIRPIREADRDDLFMLRLSLTGEWEGGRLLHDGLVGVAGGAAQGMVGGAVPGALIGGAVGGLINAGTDVAGMFWYNTKRNEEKAAWQAGDLSEKLDKIADLIHQTNGPASEEIKQIGTEYKNYIDASVEKKTGIDVRTNRFNPEFQKAKADADAANKAAGQPDQQSAQTAPPTQTAPPWPQTGSVAPYVSTQSRKPRFRQVISAAGSMNVSTNPANYQQAGPYADMQNDANTHIQAGDNPWMNAAVALPAYGATDYVVSNQIQQFLLNNQVPGVSKKRLVDKLVDDASHKIVKQMTANNTQLTSEQYLKAVLGELEKSKFPIKQFLPEIQGHLDLLANRGEAILKAKDLVIEQFAQRAKQTGQNISGVEKTPEFQQAFLNKVRSMGIKTDGGGKVGGRDLFGGQLSEEAESAAHLIQQRGLDAVSKNVIDPKSLVYKQSLMKAYLANPGNAKYNGMDQAAYERLLSNRFAPSTEKFLTLKNGTVLQRVVNKGGDVSYLPVQNAAGQAIKAEGSGLVPGIAENAGGLASKLKGVGRGIKGFGTGLVVSAAASYMAEKAFDIWELHQFGGPLGVAKEQAKEAQKIVDEVNKLTSNRADVVAAGKQVIDKLNEALGIAAPTTVPQTAGAQAITPAASGSTPIAPTPQTSATVPQATAAPVAPVTQNAQPRFRRP